MTFKFDKPSDEEKKLSEKLPIALTIGDAAGVGSELILRTALELQEETVLVVYGCKRLLEAAKNSLPESIGPFPILRSIDKPRQALRLPKGVLGVIDVVSPLSSIASAGGPPYPWGEALPQFGKLQYESLLVAIDDAMNGRVSAIVTAPWHKARLRDAGLPPTGHTEVLAEKSGTKDVLMVLAGDVLRVGLVTTHVPLRSVPKMITKERIVSMGKKFAEGLQKYYQISNPKIAVLGLNPHAGEDGVLGDEETEIISPAIAALQELEIAADGPHPADTIFPQIANGSAKYDGVLAMYHDQGLGPLKTMHFEHAVNITFGLPFFRISVDHGTAYDIAGKGVAKTSSFINAVKHAVVSSES